MKIRNTYFLARNLQKISSVFILLIAICLISLLSQTHAQAKLVSVVKGTVLDVIVDLRKESRTFGKYIMEELSEYNNRQLFLPKGMAHGFLTMEDNTIFSYKCSDFYDKESEDSIVWNDSTLNIKWPNSNPILSEKDENAKKFSSFISPF